MVKDLHFRSDGYPFGPLERIVITVALSGSMLSDPVVEVRLVSLQGRSREAGRFTPKRRAVTLVFFHVICS